MRVQNKQTSVFNMLFINIDYPIFVCIKTYRLGKKCYFGLLLRKKG